MDRSIFNPVYAVREGRFFYLLAALLCYILFTPFLEDFLRLKFLYDLFMTAILLASIVSVRTNKTQTIIAVGLAVPMILLIWITHANPSKALHLSANLFILAFLSYIIVLILYFVFSTRQVTRHVIFGAISAYLLIGIAWSIVYFVLETLHPGSFSINIESAASNPGQFLYFSFVTITTLGYGDITPLNQKARSLATGEALVGQIYMTVLIAWLVGLYVSRKVSEKAG